MRMLIIEILIIIIIIIIIIMFIYIYIHTYIHTHTCYLLKHGQGLVCRVQGELRPVELRVQLRAEGEAHGLAVLVLRAG